MFVNSACLDDEVTKELYSTDRDAAFLAWLAGFWEGEGSFRVRLRSNGTLRSSEAAIWQSNKDVLDGVRNKLGFGNVRLHRKGKTPNQADHYYLNISGIPRIQKFFELILPYMQFRQEMVKANLKLLEGRQKRRVREPN